jgi:rfaE bifunctional protein nucleotidyltransferase chain/domain
MPRGKVPNRAPRKVRPLGELLKIRARLRRRGETVVLTNGCFDLIHGGHIGLFRRAKKWGDVLVVALNSDASVRRLKGPGRPVVPAEARAEVLAALAAVDLVLIFNEPDPARVIRSVQPDVLVKGGDWPIDQIVGADVVRAKVGVVRSLPYEEGFSTTALIRRMARHGKRNA